MNWTYINILVYVVNVFYLYSLYSCPLFFRGQATKPVLPNRQQPTNTIFLATKTKKYLKIQAGLKDKKQSFEDPEIYRIGNVS